MNETIEKKVRYLEMIQGVINRMASNSFMLKGWAVTLASGVFVLTPVDGNLFFFLVAYIPIVCFWVLDSYYLAEERAYRKLYKEARKLDESDVDFNMTAEKVGKKAICKCMFSISELLLYIPLAVVAAVVMIILSAVLS